MSKLLQWAFIAFVGWQAYQYYEANSGPTASEATVVVYGRDSCGFTQRAKRDLDAAGVPYAYMSVDRPADANVLHTGMEAQDISTRRYLLPMIETNGRLQERPDLNDVVQRYRDLAKKLANKA